MDCDGLDMSLEYGSEKYRIFMRELLGKRPLSRPRRWEDNIKMNFRKMGCEDGGWMKLGQDRVP
jgi:hypothetical protein